MVKNVFELFPGGGLDGAKRNFERAWQWAISYPYSSLGYYAGQDPSPILCSKPLNGAFSSVQEFKVFAKDVISSGNWQAAEFDIGYSSQTAV